MPTSPSLHDRLGYLMLSIEALWIARVIQDALDVALEHDRQHCGLAPERRTALRLNRDVFERLGQYGCSPEPVTALSESWSAASRVELIRQVAVHWRALIDTSFGSTVSAHIIQSLTDDEVRLLEHIQRFSRSLQMQAGAITHCMQQQLQTMVQHKSLQRMQRCAVFLKSIDGKV